MLWSCLMKSSAFRQLNYITCFITVWVPWFSFKVACCLSPRPAQSHLSPLTESVECKLDASVHVSITFTQEFIHATQHQWHSAWHNRHLLPFFVLNHSGIRAMGLACYGALPCSSGMVHASRYPVCRASSPVKGLLLEFDFWQAENEWFISPEYLLVELSTSTSIAGSDTALSLGLKHGDEVLGYNTSVMHGVSKMQKYVLQLFEQVFVSKAN